jgi:hypothetical protein
MALHFRPMKGHHRKKEKTGQENKGKIAFHAVDNLLFLNVTD